VVFHRTGETTWCPLIEEDTDNSSEVIVPFVVENPTVLFVVELNSLDDVLRLPSIPGWIDMSLMMRIRLIGSVAESWSILYS
jgi:hypothetical protein